MFIYPFFHLFVCFFVRSCHRSRIPIECMCLRKKKKKKKKKKSHAGPKTKRPYAFSKILLKLSECTRTCWSGTLVIICFLGRRPHYKNKPIQIYRKFHLQKLNIFRWITLMFSYICSKHRSWVPVRTASARRFLRVPTIYIFEQK